MVEQHWNYTPYYANAAQTLNGKFKQVRSGPKKRSKNLANLSRYINNFNFVMAMLNGLEDQRTLSRLESRFRLKVKAHLLDHLKLK